MSESVEKLFEQKLNTEEVKHAQTLCEARAMDYAVVWAIATRFATPFEKWKAFKLGIINKDGDILRPLKTPADNDAFTPLDNIICRIKKLVPKYLWYLLTFSYIFRGFITYSAYKGSYYLNEKHDVEKMQEEMLILEEKKLAICRAKKEMDSIIKGNSKFTEEEFWSYVANLRDEE
jgi:hypothetical protein